MSLDVEGVVDRGVGGEETLGRALGFEALLLPFSSSDWQMGILDPIVLSQAARTVGGITKQGGRYLRQMLVVGSLAVVRYAVRNGTRRPWLVQLLARRTPKVAAVALPTRPREWSGRS